MTTSQRRIMLLAGASISALGLSSPALADPWYPAARPSDALGNTVTPGVFTADETIVICELDVDDSPPLLTDPCFFGAGRSSCAGCAGWGGGGGVVVVRVGRNALAARGAR